jgi:hypothetical protein
MQLGLRKSKASLTRRGGPRRVDLTARRGITHAVDTRPNMRLFSAFSASLSPRTFALASYETPSS